MIVRERYMRLIRDFMDKPVIKIITGMRRSGKSALLELTRQLRHAYQHVQHPVIPAGHKPGEGPPVAVGEMAERPRHRLLYHHFAKLTHDKEGDNPGDGVPQQDRGACHTDRLRDT